METNKKAQKINLIEGEQTVDQDSIDEIKRETYKIESMGRTIAENLDEQGKKMQSIRSNINFLEGDVESSDSLISRMIARENRNRTIFYGLIILMLIVFAGIVIYKIMKSDNIPSKKIS